MARPLLRTFSRLRSIAVPRAPLLCGRGYSTSLDEAVNTASGQSPPRSSSTAGNTLDAQDIVSGPKTIKLRGKHNRLLEISHLQLRDSCKCPRCVDVHSKQRNFRLSDIPFDIKPRSIHLESGTLEMTWENDIPGFDHSHTSKYTIKELEFPLPYQCHSPAGRKRDRTLWGRKDMQELQHWISYEDYMHDDKKFTHSMRCLAIMGLIFVQDIPDSRELVEKLATRMGPLRNTFYGPTWDVRTVPEAKNVAYTSQFLDFHMDLMYMNEPPGFQLLHCLRNSCDGGESLFADTFKVAHEMLDTHPDYFHTLTNTNLCYEYSHKENCYDNTWPVFEVGGQTKRGPALLHVNYSPPFQAPVTAAVGNDGHKNSDLEGKMTALRHFANELGKEENIFKLKLNPGECVIFENRRIVHARRQFDTDSGERWLAGAYVDEDAVLSRFRVQGNANLENWALRNKSWALAHSANVAAQLKTKKLAAAKNPELAPLLLDPGKILTNVSPAATGNQGRPKKTIEKPVPAQKSQPALGNQVGPKKTLEELVSDIQLVSNKPRSRDRRNKRKALSTGGAEKVRSQEKKGES